MIVDRGTTSFLGTTPLATSIDPSRRYDLVFTSDSHPTLIEHLDPSLTHHIDAIFAGGKRAAPMLAPAIQHAVPVKPVAVAVAVAPAVAGTLMISSKPPCQIYVDGAPTNLTTPQRAIPLAAGAHKITLVSATDHALKKTLAVEITSGKPTKVIQDLMK